jgi:hypothetical protein
MIHDLIPNRLRRAAGCLPPLVETAIAAFHHQLLDLLNRKTASLAGALLV